MENTSDSFKPGPLLFCMKIERSVCYKVTDNTIEPLQQDICDLKEEVNGVKLHLENEI